MGSFVGSMWARTSGTGRHTRSSTRSGRRKPNTCKSPYTFRVESSKRGSSFDIDREKQGFPKSEYGAVFMTYVLTVFRRREHAHKRTIIDHIKRFYVSTPFQYSVVLTPVNKTAHEYLAPTGRHFHFSGPYDIGLNISKGRVFGNEFFPPRAAGESMCTESYRLDDFHPGSWCVYVFFSFFFCARTPSSRLKIDGSPDP